MLNKSYILIWTQIQKRTKNDFEKGLFKLMNSKLFKKAMENVRKHRDIKLLIKERRRNYLVPEQHYHTKKFFTEKLLVIEIKKWSAFE